MKVGIIAANQIRYSPYIFFYTRILDDMGIGHELIIPRRGSGSSEGYDGVCHVLPWVSAPHPAISYMRYAHAVTRLVRRQGYDALIVLTSPNAVFLAMWLKRHYPGRYIVDIRDYSHENIPPYYLLEKLSVRNSLMNVISSPRFSSFLPQAEYHVCHNFSMNDYTRIHASFQRAQEPITIGYVGALSYVEQCKRLMELVSRDRRFRMDFYGTSSSEAELKAYADALASSSITFHGGYTAPQKSGIIGQVDILFNAYGNGCPLLDCALSNKLYDALIFRKPIITCPDTAMTDMGGMLAYPMDLAGTGDLDALYGWYQELEGGQVDAFAQSTIEACVKEHEATVRSLTERLQSLM